MKYRITPPICTAVCPPICLAVPSWLLGLEERGVPETCLQHHLVALDHCDQAEGGFDDRAQYDRQLQQHYSKKAKKGSRCHDVHEVCSSLTSKTARKSFSTSVSVSSWYTCIRQRDRQTERKRGRKKDRQIDRQADRADRAGKQAERQADRQTERQREREREREREMTQRERERERESETEREREAERERETDRERERESDG